MKTYSPNPQGINTQGNAQYVNTLSLDPLVRKIQMLQQQIQENQTGSSTKRYTLEDIFSYPFDKSLIMILFPPHFEVSKFDKYKGNIDPQDHVREFYATCIEVAHDETYLMRLFPWSFRGQDMDWFSKLPFSIKSFKELVDMFVTHYSYNIRHEVTILDLWNTKQNKGNHFLPSCKDGITFCHNTWESFLNMKRWISLYKILYNTWVIEYNYNVNQTSKSSLKMV